MTAWSQIFIIANRAAHVTHVSRSVRTPRQLTVLSAGVRSYRQAAGTDHHPLTLHRSPQGVVNWPDGTPIELLREATAQHAASTVQQFGDSIPEP